MSETKIRVLLVDDEVYPISLYIKAMSRSGLIVDYCSTTEEAMDSHRASQSYDVILLDIMMDPGERFEGEAHQGGIRTGIFMLKELMRLHPTTPIIIITNVSDPDITAELKGMKPSVLIASKLDYPPLELVDLVERTVSKQEGVNS